jgi:two-component system cell cycle sensor histidine kinase/response regulator CckA
VLSCTKSDASGTRFEMRIPQASKASQPAEADHLESASRHPDSKHRVLLVEDEVGVRDIVTQMLGAIGYDTLVAENAAHALALLEEQDVDLLISDVVMPDMRGPEIYRHALKLRPGLSALFVSGYSEEVISEVPTGDNRVGYLSKPFTLRELRTAVDGLITSKEALS